MKIGENEISSNGVERKFRRDTAAVRRDLASSSVKILVSSSVSPPSNRPISLGSLSRASWGTSRWNLDVGVDPQTFGRT